jgi:hypothetical protein
LADDPDLWCYVALVMSESQQRVCLRGIKPTTSSLLDARS